MFLSLIKASEDRSPFGQFWFEPVSVRTGSGQRVNADTAMRLTTVYACVRVLAETMACLPFCLYRPNADGGKDAVTDHWLYRLLARRPNDWQTPFEWMEMMQGHLALRGNCYNMILANRRGEIEQLVPLHPDRVKVELLDNGSYRYLVKDLAGNETAYPRSALWHIRGLSADGYVGLNPIAVARESIGVGLAAQDYGARFFANDAKPSGGWIEFPGEFRDKAARDVFKESWQEAQGGINRGKLAVLDRGMKYHEIGVTNKDSQFLEARQFQVAEICRMFRVPPHLAGDLSRSTNNNIEWQSLEFVKFTMTPWAERWESSIEYSLLPEGEDLEVEFDFDNLERGDMKTRGEFYTTGITAGWLTRNEARLRENMNPLDGLDEPLEPMNMGHPGDKPKPKPGAAPGDQQPQDDDSADESNARLLAIAGAAAVRVARKETEMVRRAIAAGTDLTEAYDRHARFVAECLAVNLTAARAYCDAQLQSIDTQELIEHFEARAICRLERVAAGADVRIQPDAAAK